MTHAVMRHRRVVGAHLGLWATLTILTLGLACCFHDRSLPQTAAASQDAVEVRISPSTTFRVLADLDDDGVIDERDVALKEKGIPELVRLDDSVCNGRDREADRSGSVDDDLQLVVLEFPDATTDGLMLSFKQASPSPECTAYFDSRASDGARVTWPLPVSKTSTFDRANRRLCLWIRAKSDIPAAGPTREWAWDCSGGGASALQDSLRVTYVGGLGDPNYFAAARDYLCERDSLGVLPNIYVDEISCPSASTGSADAQGFRVIVMRHELARMEVLETFHTAADESSRIQDIYGAVKANPEQTLIVNGSFFKVDKTSPSHGNRTIGAVVHRGIVSPVSGPQRWKVQETEPAAYCLFQGEDRCGDIELTSDVRKENDYFVPTVTRGGKEVLAYEALGGLPRLHSQKNVMGVLTSCLGIVTVKAPDGQEHRLIWLAMSESDPERQGDRSGGVALRKYLEQSGAFGAGNASARGVMTHLDGGFSLCMAYNIGSHFEIPIHARSHASLLPGPRVNNYLMFRIGACK